MFRINDSLGILSSPVFTSSLLYRWPVPSGTDLNTVITSGYYWVTNITNLINIPNGIGPSIGPLIVFRPHDSMRITQVYIATNAIYHRTMVDGETFLNWYKISGTELIPE